MKPLVVIIDNTPVTNSDIIANAFGFLPNSICKKIKNIKRTMKAIGRDIGIHPVKDYYNLDYNAFCLLTTGFLKQGDLEVKLSFIEEFHDAERSLLEKKDADAFLEDIPGSLEKIAKSLRNPPTKGKELHTGFLSALKRKKDKVALFGINYETPILDAVTLESKGIGPYGYNMSPTKEEVKEIPRTPKKTDPMSTRAVCAKMGLRRKPTMEWLCNKGILRKSPSMHASRGFRYVPTEEHFKIYIAAKNLKENIVFFTAKANGGLFLTEDGIKYLSYAKEQDYIPANCYI